MSLALVFSVTVLAETESAPACRSLMPLAPVIVTAPVLLVALTEPPRLRDPALADSVTEAGALMMTPEAEEIALPELLKLMLVLALMFAFTFVKPPD